MKNFRTFFIALFLSVGTLTVTQAQNSEIAHINTQELIQSMPGYTSAMNELSELQKNYQQKIQDMMKEASALSEKYQSEAGTMSDAENAKRAKQLQETQNKILKYRQSVSQKLRKKEQELLQPIFKKAKAAIEAVAAEEGYEYVLDSTQGTGVIVAKGEDLMDEVKAQLGI